MPRAKKSKPARPSVIEPAAAIDTKGVFVPAKHLEFAKSVLEDERRNQARADSFADDATKAAEAGVNVPLEVRVAAAAMERAKAEALKKSPDA